MTSFEWLTIIYLAGIIAAGWGRQSPRRLRAAGYAAIAIALVIVARFTVPSAVRAWLPHAYLVLGYWLPALLTPLPAGDRFQRRLAAADARLKARWMWRVPSWTAHWTAMRLGTWILYPLRRIRIAVLGARSAPKKTLATSHGLRWAGVPNARFWRVGVEDIKGGAREWFELAYLLCYPVVPISFTIVWTRGTREDAVRFWLAVLTAGFACYATLPWTAAWPPRLLSVRPHRGLAAINVHVLRHLSHGFNTFPSGHVAVAVAASLAVASVAPAAGAAVGVIAVSIAIAAVIGRYHYAVDVIAGLAVGLLAWALTGDRWRP